MGQVLKDTEILLSASLTFSVHETEEGFQFISCDGQSATRWLPAGDKKVQATIHRDKNNAPFVTNGDESWYCVTFFDSSPEEPTTSSAAVPLPGPAASTNPPNPILQLVPAPTGLPSAGKAEVHPPPTKPEAPVTPMPGMKATSAQADLNLTDMCVCARKVFKSLRHTRSHQRA